MYAIENHNLVSNYALVENGKVTNVIWMAKNNASEFSNAVFLGELPVGIGDEYKDNKFYREGKEIKTQAENLLEENNELTNLLGEAVEDAYQSDMEVINNV